MKIHQNYIALAAAAGFSLLVLMLNIATQSPDSLLRMGFAAALYLVSRDVLAGASLAQGPRSLLNPDRWILAFYLALYFGTFMLLALWRGMDQLQAQLVGIVIGAVLYGGLMAFAFSNKPNPYAHHFQTEKPMRFGKAGLVLYYFAPALKLLLVWGVVRILPATPSYLFFTLILIGFAFPRYQRVSNGNWIWAHFPAIIGYLILVLLLAFHL